jgi:CheY-like chemotaxis protein
MDGLELTRRIRTTPAWASLTVVALTAYAMRGDEERMIAAGCDGYISKPIESRAFARQVMEYMEKYAGASEQAGGFDDPETMAGPEISLLKNEFLTDARREARAFLSMPDIDLGEEPTFRALHRWAGIGKSIGLAPVTDLARAAGCHSQQPVAVRGPLIRPLIASILAILNRPPD